MEKKNGKWMIIVILLGLCVLFVVGKLVFYNENNKNSEFNETNITESRKDYTDFIGSWHNVETQNEITIKNITNNEITFTWFLYRLAVIDEDTTIAFLNGKGIFYFEGYDDKNYDGKQTEDEKYIRKATIELTDDGVNVVVENVTSIDNNYKVLDNFSGSVYIESGTYTHPDKYK